MTVGTRGPQQTPTAGRPYWPATVQVTGTCWRAGFTHSYIDERNRLATRTDPETVHPLSQTLYARCSRNDFQEWRCALSADEGN